MREVDGVAALDEARDVARHLRTVSDVVLPPETILADGRDFLMAGLKLAESRRGQDLQRAALAELMAVGVLAVIAPELAPSLLQASTAIVVLAGLLCQEAGDRRSLGQALRRSLQLGLAALPLLLLLFLLMPRIGPLWSVPGQSTGRTGLSDQLDTGTISRLVQDPAPTLPLLHTLQDDPSAYVRRSVANHVGDIAKDHPELAFELCGKWLKGASGERKWVIRHAVRHSAA